MSQLKSQRVAWLLPAMGTGGISFQHILDEFTQEFPHTVVFTGQWPGYAPGHEDSFRVQEVGATQHIQLAQTPNGYEIGFSYASPTIVKHLLQFQPQVIFANAFSIWTVLALLLKWLGGWKVIIVYEGGSPTYESAKPSVRLVARKLMVKLADAFVINSQSGKSYFLDVLGADPKRVFAQPFLVASTKALLRGSNRIQIPELETTQRPIFLYVGQLIPRKGLTVLLEACALLKQKGAHDYTLWIVGDGEQKPELQQFVEQAGLGTQVKWLGKVAYQHLGAYFQAADIFVFPTYEDIWGMVLVEAMAFGKPVICSTGAGAVEMVATGRNGFVYDPSQPEQLADYMQQFLIKISLISEMGRESERMMSYNTPKKASEVFVEAVNFV